MSPEDISIAQAQLSNGLKSVDQLPIPFIISVVNHCFKRVGRSCKVNHTTIISKIAHTMIKVAKVDKAHSCDLCRLLQATWGITSLWVIQNHDFVVKYSVKILEDFKEWEKENESIWHGLIDELDSWPELTVEITSDIAYCSLREALYDIHKHWAHFVSVLFMGGTPSVMRAIALMVKKNIYVNISEQIQFYIGNFPFIGCDNTELLQSMGRSAFKSSEQFLSTI